jgi:SAM-dependent methyltransferase
VTLPSKWFSLNSSRIYLEKLIRTIAFEVPAGAMVLDAGSGRGQYRSFFDHARYENADFMQVDKKYGEVMYVCDLAAIPVEDKRFDFILFTQTMEHLKEPQRVLTELMRVLKSGGRLLYTGPLFYEEHEQPHDYFRYTQFALRYFFQEAGLIIDKLEWLEGYFGTLAYQLTTASWSLPLRSEDFGGGLKGLCMVPVSAVLRIKFRLLAGLFHRLDVRHKFTRSGYPKNYVVVAHKP